jgi:hypothetical protein
MNIILLVNKILGYFGFKITVNKIVKSKKNRKIDFLRGIHNNNKTVIVYLDIGDDTKDFTLNSIKSFRNSDLQTSIIVYTDKKEKFEVNYSQKFDFQIVEYSLLGGSQQFGSYSEFGTQQFNKICNFKWEIILYTFELGYEKVIYSDFDIVFLDSPVNYLNLYNRDFLFMVQSESQNAYPPVICNGFMIFNEKSIPLLSDLNDLAKTFDGNDQVLLNRYLRDHNHLTELIHILPEALFANGLHWKNLLSNDKIQGIGIAADSVKPIMFHANFLVGLDNKQAMLKQLNLWTDFQTME